MGGARAWQCRWRWWCLAAVVVVSSGAVAAAHTPHRQQKEVAAAVGAWQTMGGAQQKHHHHHHLRRRHLHLRPEQQAGKQEAVMAEAESARSSRLPWQHESPPRQVRLPLLQDGEQRFSFYVYGRNGLLQEATLSLHQVQAMLLECSPYRGLYGENTRSSSELDPALHPSPQQPPARPSSNIHGVVATVQQMVSSEAAQTQGTSSSSSSTPSANNDQSEESLEIPEDMLQSLHNVPEHIATQWQFLSTYSPPTPTTTVTTTTLNPTSVPVAATTTTAAPSGESEEVIEPNRGSNLLSRRPSAQEGTTNEVYEITTQNLEATEDYHSSPDVQSVDTVIPSGSTTTTSEAPATAEDEVTEITESPSGGKNSSEATTMPPMSTNEYEEGNGKQEAKTSEDTLLSTLTDFYAQSYNNARLPPSSTASPAILSTFIDYATSVLSGDSHASGASLPPSVSPPAPTQPPQTIVTLPMTPSTLDDSVDDTAAITYPASRIDYFVPTDIPSEPSAGVTLSYGPDNLLSIDLVDPVESENPYDVMPLDGQSGTYPVRSPASGHTGGTEQSHVAAIEPLNPYESAAMLLEVLQSHNGFPDRTTGEAVPSSTETRDTADTHSPPSLSTTNLLSADEGTDDGRFTDIPSQHFTATGGGGQDATAFTSQHISQPSPSPAAVPPLSSNADEAQTQEPVRSPLPHSPPRQSGPSSAPSSASSVLPPSQLAGTGNQDKIDLEALQVHGNLTEGDIFYDYYGSSVYLDNVPEHYYDYDELPSSQPQLNTTDDLGFPGPNATSPYHDHHHHDHHHHDHHHDHHDHDHKHHHGAPPEPSATLLQAPEDNPGLEASVENLNPDIREFVDAMNDITFRVYKHAAEQHKRQNFVMSPLNLISTLGMLLLGARGLSADVLRDFMQMDKFYTFNPHLVLRNVTQAIQSLKDVHDVTFFSQFLVDKEKSPYSTEFFAKAIKVFYDAEIQDMEAADFETFVREKVNSLIRQNTRSETQNFIREEEPLFLTPPLSTVATSFLHARWSLPVTQEDLVDMSFIRFPTAERRLIQTTGLRKKVTVNAGFSRAAAATSAEVPLYSSSGLLSLVLVMPGEQKNFVANGLKRLESSLSSAKWSELLRSMLPNTVNLKMPVFRHRAFHNFSTILSDLGLQQLFQKSEADLSGINHIKNLYLNDVVQLTEFQSCQIEKPRTTSVLSGRRRRSSAPTLDTLTKDITADANYLNHPTYIYGLPMVEYAKVRLTRMESGERHDAATATQQKAPQKNMSTRTMDGGASGADIRASMLRSSPDTLQEEASPQAATPLDTHVNYLSEETNTTGGDAAETQTQDDEGTVEEELVTYPEYYYYNNYHYNDQQYEYKEHMYDYGEGGDGMWEPEKMMGKEEAEEEEERVDRMGTASDGPGAHYRQSDVGTLAFDRAFLYAVRHNPTGLLLFLGRYLDPQAN